MSWELFDYFEDIIEPVKVINEDKCKHLVKCLEHNAFIVCDECGLYLEDEYINTDIDYSRIILKKPYVSVKPIFNNYYAFVIDKPRNSVLVYFEKFYNTDKYRSSFLRELCLYQSVPSGIGYLLYSYRKRLLDIEDKFQHGKPCILYEDIEDLYLSLEIKKRQIFLDILYDLKYKNINPTLSRLDIKKILNNNIRKVFIVFLLSIIQRIDM